MSRPIKVLLIEDSESDAGLVLRSLARGDFEPTSQRVDTAADLREALKAETWDLVICDYNMPSFDAPTALAVLQAYDLDIPFIVVSGNVGEENAVTMMKSGAHDFLLKENLARLVPAVERELREAEVHRARRLSEKALEENKARLAATEEFALVMTTHVGLDGVWRKVPPTLCRFLGYSESELLATTYSQVLDSQEVASYEAKIAQLRSGQLKSFDAEMRFLTKDGKTVCGYTNFSIVLDNAGEPAYFLVYIRDITDYHRTQEQLRLAAQVFEGIGESIIIADADRAILSVNRAFTQFTGYTADEVRGQRPNMFRSDKHEDTFYDALWQAVDKNGYWQGEVWSRKRSGEIYPQWISITAVPDDAGKTKHYISIATDISARKSAEERIHYLAHFDLLTDLPNRVLLQDRMAQAIATAERDQEEIAILFIDLDRFKQINDSLGHPIGDRVLKTVAERLKRCIRDSDTGARLGGDEFVVVLPKTGAEGSAHVAQKIQESLSEPFLIGTHKLSITPSIGMSIYPHDGTELHTLIKNADSAVYRAKELGRNNFQFFTHTMTRAAFELMMVENDLRQALTNGELVLHYQPQIDLVSGAVIGAETLIRWNHPQKGLMYPNQFIQIAEDAGLIVPIGKWVLTEACRQNAEWLSDGLKPGRVAVNLSAVQFRHKGFSKIVEQILKDTGLEPRYLDIELTESVVMEDIEKSVATMQELAAMGVSLSIDDFGTGYSSLYYLKRLPLHKLKIDRTFVQDCAHDADDAAIVQAVIGLAHSLRLMVLAEGVEDVEQLHFLATHRCDALQGFYFSKPLSAAEYSIYLRDSAENEPAASTQPARSRA